MSGVTHISSVLPEHRKGSLRIAYLPRETQPVTFSVHGAIAEHYRVAPASLPNRTPPRSICDRRHCRLNARHLRNTVDF